MNSNIIQEQNILSDDEISYILNLPDVIFAKNKVDEKESGSIKFTIALNDIIKEKIREKFNLDISNIESIPMRWIKGDTVPHIDKGINEFDNTYLMYLTDSEGEFIVDEQSYPITKGSGYIFNEGLNHETRGTGLEPRLLFGPMSESGFAVGYGGISGPGGTTLYIRQSGSNYEYSNDQQSWSNFTFPIFITNTDTSAGVIKVEFVSDMTLTTLNDYFTCNSSHIQFGNSSLKTDGTRPIITIDNVPFYVGLIKNGDTFVDGYNNIYIKNIYIHSINGSGLSTECGWIGYQYFGRGAIDNYIINCSSDGVIGDDNQYGCGGIVGSYAGGFGGLLTIIGCSSSGGISYDGGGIVGPYGGGDNGTISCISCWSTGNIIGLNRNDEDGTGGIFGRHAGSDDGSASAINCYSTGLIGIDCGGIFASFSAHDRGSATAHNCYSLGTINTNGGGIFGAYAGDDNGGSTSVTNCYSVGTIATSGNGIYGSLKVTGTETNCYSANGSWSTSNANSFLTGVPTSTIGTTWVATTINQSYELLNMGYTPYNVNNITNTFGLERFHASTVAPGDSTTGAIISGKSYTILEKRNGNAGSYNTITINGTTGVISTTNSTAVGTYTLYIRNNGSYNITTYELTVGGEICFAKGTPVETDQGIILIEELDMEKHTIKNKKITEILKTKLPEDKMILIKKDGLKKDYPSEDTIVSKNHRIKYDNKLIPAERLRKMIKEETRIKEIEYNDYVYNVRLEEYDFMIVNNMEVDTLLEPNFDNYKRHKLFKSYEKQKY